MHRSVLDFVRRALNSNDIADKAVMEVGSANVNGSVRPFIESLDPAVYLGVDAAPGPGVDVVANCEQLTEQLNTGCWDVVISTEMLEHVRDWRACVRELALATRPGGLLLITTRSPGFEYHAYPEDHWRYTIADMKAICEALDLDPIYLQADDPGTPGVFLMARKPENWLPHAEKLNSIEPAPAERFPVPDKDPDDPVKLVIALPLYHSVSTEWVRGWLCMDMRHVAHVVAVDGSMYLPQKMETLVAKAFEVCPDFDRLVVMEQDMIAPTDAFERIASYGDEYDIVGSTYFKHEAPHHVMAWMQIDKPRFSPLTREVVKRLVENPGMYHVDGVAMGLTSIHRRVFTDWDPAVPMWVPTPPMVGHDLHFCNEAKKQGFGIYLDSGLGCGHLTLVPIGYGDSQAALSAEEPDTWEQAFAKNEMPSLDKVT